MNQQSRRLFLKYTSLGAAAVGAGAAAPALVASGASAASGQPHDGPLVAYVADARTGDVAVMVGEREVVLHDTDLASRLGQIAASAR